jgi:hypothetical protein
VWASLAAHAAAHGWPLQVASLDCTAARATCGGRGVRGYPTLQFIVGNRTHTHTGPRTLAQLTRFAGIIGVFHIDNVSS